MLPGYSLCIAQSPPGQQRARWPARRRTRPCRNPDTRASYTKLRAEPYRDTLLFRLKLRQGRLKPFLSQYPDLNRKKAHFRRKTSSPEISLTCIWNLHFWFFLVEIKRRNCRFFGRNINSYLRMYNFFESAAGINLTSLPLESACLRLRRKSHKNCRILGWKPKNGTRWTIRGPGSHVWYKPKWDRIVVLPDSTTYLIKGGLSPRMPSYSWRVAQWRFFTMAPAGVPGINMIVFPTWDGS
jgi:hypothetical protein